MFSVLPEVIAAALVLACVIIYAGLKLIARRMFNRS